MGGGEFESLTPLPKYGHVPKYIEHRAPDDRAGTVNEYTKTKCYPLRKRYILYNYLNSSPLFKCQPVYSEKILKIPYTIAQLKINKQK